jgi:hypothetical protein
MLRQAVSDTYDHDSLAMLGNAIIDGIERSKIFTESISRHPETFESVITDIRKTRI